MAMYAQSRKQLATAIMIMLLLSFSLSYANENVDVAELFNQWMVRHQIVYPSNLHREKRFEIFKANSEYVDNFNKMGNKAYTLGLNQFSDLSWEEFVDTISCGAESTLTSTHSYPDVGLDYLDYDTCDELRDWTKEGYVSPPACQTITQKCGSCWAFTAAATVEGIAYIMKNISVQLSVQQIIDCNIWNSHGCKGGFVTSAFDYIHGNGGLTSAANYPYIGQDGTCNLDKAKQIEASITAFARVPANDEYELMKAVCQQPVAASIRLSPAIWHYAGGVLTDDCEAVRVTHAVTIVGMGETDDGIKYWKIKNSWCQSWGEGGYMRIARGTDKPEGLCLINGGALYPIID